MVFRPRREAAVAKLRRVRCGIFKKAGRLILPRRVASLFEGVALDSWKVWLVIEKEGEFSAESGSRARRFAETIGQICTRRTERGERLV